MYSTILVPLENSRTDEAILTHVRPLARLAKATLILIHVADGFAARNQEALNLQDSPEIEGDRAYLSRREAELSGEGFLVRSVLEKGDPAARILAVADIERADLIAMATHGHGLVRDLLHGSVADQLRHRTDIPILMVRAARTAAGADR